jgi:FkbM family methyltransferase
LKKYLQFGSNDGVRHDLLRPVISREDKALLFEPVPWFFEALQENYADFPHVLCHNTAVSGERSGEVTFYALHPEDIQKFATSQQHFEDLCGLSSMHLDRNNLRDVPREFIRELTVQCVAVAGLVCAMEDTEIDGLYVDCEGEDLPIVLNFPYHISKPRQIVFECPRRKPFVYGGRARRHEALRFLRTKGYAVSSDAQNVTAVLT